MASWCQNLSWKVTPERSTRRSVCLLCARIVTILRNTGLKCTDIGSATRETSYFVTSVIIKLTLNVCWDSTKTACMIQQNMIASRVSSGQTRWENFISTIEQFTEESCTTVSRAVSRLHDQTTWSSTNAESTAMRDSIVYFATLEILREVGLFCTRSGSIQQCLIQPQGQKLTQECRFCSTFLYKYIFLQLVNEFLLPSTQNRKFVFLYPLEIKRTWDCQRPYQPSARFVRKICARKKTLLGKF